MEKQVRAAKREARLAEAAAGDKPKAGGDLRCGICGDGHNTAYCPHHVPQYYKATDEVRRPVLLDKDNIPKGCALAPMECARTESGECYEGPPLCVIPMICFFCYKVGDHLPDDCPREITLEDILPPIQSGKLDWFGPDEAEASF